MRGQLEQEELLSAIDKNESNSRKKSEKTKDSKPKS